METIARIIDFLVRFAGEHVEVSNKHGRKRLAFDEELVAALDHTVVMPEIPASVINPI